jgi:hypothetical protein
VDGWTPREVLWSPWAHPPRRSLPRQFTSQNVSCSADHLWGSRARHRNPR